MAGWPVCLKPHGTHWASRLEFQTSGEPHNTLQGQAGLPRKVGCGDHRCHSPTPVHFQRYCRPVLDSGLIVDSYRTKEKGEVVSKIPGT